MLMNELNSTAAEVIEELDAPETMLLLDWNAAVEANFPPASILIAGALSPLCLKLMSYHHLLQLVTVGLPVLALCVAAVLVDWSAPCPSIPGIFAWICVQTVLAALLVLGHGIQFSKCTAAKANLDSRMQAIADQNRGDSITGLRDHIIGQSILIQEALLIENDIRASVWNKIVGVATAL